MVHGTKILKPAHVIDCENIFMAPRYSLQSRPTKVLFAIGLCIFEGSSALNHFHTGILKPSLSLSNKNT